MLSVADCDARQPFLRRRACPARHNQAHRSALDVRQRLARAVSDAIFVGTCQRASPLLKFFRQEQYASNRFPIADPSRELPVLVRLRQKVGHDLPLIHCTLHLKLDDGAANCSNFVPIIKKRPQRGAKR